MRVDKILETPLSILTHYTDNAKEKKERKETQTTVSELTIRLNQHLSAG